MGYFDSAADVFRYLVEKQVIRIDDYDKDLLASIRQAFAIPNSKPVADYLQAEDISAQDFIVVVLRAIEPFSLMVNDLYELYSSIGSVQSGHKNLEIILHLEDGTNPFTFDLDTFRRWVRTEAKVKRFQRTWDQARAWDVVALLSQTFPAQDLDRLLRQIRQLSHDHYSDSWPSVGDYRHDSGAEKIDEILESIWSLLEDFLQEATAVSGSRVEAKGSFKDDSNQALAIMASDFWDVHIGELTLEISREVSNGNKEIIDQLIQRATDIEDAIDLLPSRAPIEVVVEHLIDLMSLPMWGKRHEVYAAWIFSLIVDAIGVENLRFWLVDGKLSFDFSGSQLASFNTLVGVVDIWAEMKTPHRNPVGKGRRRAIQPDFSITRYPVHAAETTCVAIECKQHKNGKVASNADALSDYVTGLPNARVVLAGYGPLGKTLPDRLDEGVSRRSEIFPDLHPGNPIQIDHFKSAVRAGISDILPLDREKLPFIYKNWPG